MFICVNGDSAAACFMLKLIKNVFSTEITGTGNWSYMCAMVHQTISTIVY